MKHPRLGPNISCSRRDTPWRPPVEVLATGKATEAEVLDCPIFDEKLGTREL